MTECPNCGNSGGVKVWENYSDAEDGIAPDYMGCVECNTMTDYVDWIPNK